MESVLIRYKKPKIFIIEILFMIFFAAYYILPAVNSAIGFLPMLIISFIYFLLTLRSTPYEDLKKIFSVIAVAFFVALCYYLFTESSTISKNVNYYELKRYLSKLQQIIFGFLPLLFFYRLKKHGNIKQKKAIIFVIFALFLYTLVITSRELSVNDSATRSWGNFAQMSESNVGTYGFVYAVSALIPSVLIIFHSVKNSTVKFLSFVGIIVLFTFLLDAQYTLSVLIATISVILYIFIAGKSKGLKIFIVLFLPIVFFLLPDILNLISRAVASEQMSIRFKEIADAFSGKELGYHLGGRIDLYKNSLLAFFKSPFWGNKRLYFDGHATLLTVLSNIGLLGAIPYYWLYDNGRKTIMRLTDDVSVYKKFIPVFVSFILMGLTNPIHSTMPLYMVVWLLAPLLIDILITQENENSENADFKEDNPICINGK